MRNYLRDPEFVIDSLFLATTSMHTLAFPRLINVYEPIETGTSIQLIVTATASQKERDKQEHEETDLPAEQKRRAPRPVGYQVNQFRRVGSSNNGHTPPIAALFSNLAIVQFVLSHSQLFDPAKAPFIPEHARAVPPRLTKSSFHTHAASHLHYRPQSARRLI